MPNFENCYGRAITDAHTTSRALAPGECRTPSGRTCPLCHALTLEYADELRIKNSALKEYWKQNRLPQPVEPIVPSPLGRGYRTVTKRRVFHWRGKPRLGLIGDLQEAGDRPVGIDVVHCAIEPDSHAAVYARVQQFLDSSKDKLLSAALHYVVIKGSYDELTVILNVDTFEPAVLKKINVLSKALTSSVRGVEGIFLYRDEKRSRYYLPSGGGTEHSFRRVFGRREIFQKILGRSFLYSPLSFSQTNQSILEEMAGRVESILKPDTSLHLYDFYCGYGLFALTLADKAASVTGVEISAASVDAARSNASRQHAKNAHFFRQDITQDTVASLLRKAPKRFAVILDPPRGGTAEGVIETIAAHKPENVVHIFCDVDRISHELARWKKSGYTPARSIPLDMFPGTNDLEIVIGLRGK